MKEYVTRRKSFSHSDNSMLEVCSLKAPNIRQPRLDFCKHILGVKRSIYSVAVYSELGRFQLLYIRMFNIVNLYKNNCIIKHCYYIYAIMIVSKT